MSKAENHIGVVTGYCNICGHYGDDCRGVKNPGPRYFLVFDEIVTRKIEIPEGVAGSVKEAEEYLDCIYTGICDAERLHGEIGECVEIQDQNGVVVREAPKAEAPEFKLFRHVTSGGAIYLTDCHAFANAKIIIRLDGNAPELSMRDFEAIRDRKPEAVTV